MDPIKAAHKIYEESLVAFMAHTVRAVEKHFILQRIELDLRIVPDLADNIRLGDPTRNTGATSIISSRLRRDPKSGRERVSAMIFIHKDANRHLARICIAHEIYHLLLDLDHYIESKRAKWENHRSTKSVEDACNQFAWELCKAHDKFNRDDQKRKDMLFFPDHAFEKPLTTNDTGRRLEWPEGIALDPKNPFYVKPRS